jgi:tetratricopeptide repeat protein 30
MYERGRNCLHLQAAIEYVMKRSDEAKEALTDMPPRMEEELDPVSG